MRITFSQLRLGPQETLYYTRCKGNLSRDLLRTNCVDMLPWNFSYPVNSGYNYFGETKELRPRKKCCVFLAWAVSVCWTIALPGLKSVVKIFLCAVHHCWIVNYCSSLNLCFPSAPTTLSTIFFPIALGSSLIG